GPERREPGAREGEWSLVQEIARLPAREELRVEAVEALDLEERVRERDEPPEHALDRVARVVHVAGEGREVERDLLHPALAQELDPAGHEELGQAVRRR